jgi:hypothetical protein
MERSSRRPIVALVFVALLAALLIAACGSGGDDVAAVEAPSGSTAGPTTPTTPTTLDDDPRLPFDLGPGIVAGGDDVVGEGIEVALDRFRSEIPEGAPAPATATASRLASTERDEAQAREAAAGILGVHADDVDIHYEQGWFEFHAEGHGHDDVVPETTVPPAGRSAEIDEDDAIALTESFFTVAGLEPASRPSAFENGGYLSVEVPVDLVPGTPVLRAFASVTFGPDGTVIGGYGPFGGPADEREVGVIDVATAVRRLALTQALAGYPTTTAAPPGGDDPVVLVSAELALSLREAVGPDGTPRGDRWLVPVHRFVDDDGKEWEVNAVAAEDLRLPPPR